MRELKSFGEDSDADLRKETRIAINRQQSRVYFERDCRGTQCPYCSQTGRPSASGTAGSGGSRSRYETNIATVAQLQLEFNNRLDVQKSFAIAGICADIATNDQIAVSSSTASTARSAFFSLPRSRFWSTPASVRASTICSLLTRKKYVSAVACRHLAISKSSEVAKR